MARSLKKDKPHNDELDQALKDVPKLIMQEVGQKKGDAKKTNTHQKKVWLWTGVTIFAGSILFVWGLQTMTLFYETKQESDVAETFVESGQNEFKDILNTFSDLEKQFGVTSTTQETTSTPQVQETPSEDEKQAEKNVQQILNSLFTTSTNNEEIN